MILTGIGFVILAIFIAVAVGFIVEIMLDKF